MNALFKTLIIITAVAVTSDISAQVASLPIGSTKAVLQDALRQANWLEWGIALIRKDESLERFLANGRISTYNYERDGDAALVLKQKMMEAVKSVDLNKAEYAGRKFATVYEGSKYFPGDGGLPLLPLVFNIYNEFILERNEKGELVVPAAAYEVDIVKGLMQVCIHNIFVDNVERIVLEVEDGNGNVIVREDSRKHRLFDCTTAVPSILEDPTADNRFYLPIKFAVSGQPGRVFLWYTNGVQQVFSLADGRLLPSLVIRKANSGAELTVNSSDAFTVEASEDLRQWSTLNLPPAQAPANAVFLHQFTDPTSGRTRFYRLRVTETSQQNRQ